MKNNLVSIIVPVHNCSKYIEKCITSIINQTYKNIEIICVINGSTDTSLEKLKKYKEKIIIKVIDKPSIGNARNIGINMSKGKYISFIDGDDFIDSDFIEKMVKKIEETSTDLTLCNMKEIHEETKKVKKINLYPTNIVSNKEIINNLEKFQYGPCNKLFKKELITKNQITFPIDLKYEDVPFVVKYLINARSIGKVDDYIYNYQIHKESEQTKIDEKIFDIFKIIKIYNTYLNKEKLENINIKLLINYALKTKHIKDSKLRNKFIKETYKYLNKNHPNWKKSKYIKEQKIIKKIIIKHKYLLKLYTLIF